jgi:hypothetical protein
MLSLAPLAGGNATVPVPLWLVAETPALLTTVNDIPETTAVIVNFPLSTPGGVVVMPVITIVSPTCKS